MPQSMPWSEPTAVARYGAAVGTIAVVVAAASLLKHTLEIEPVVSLLLCGVLFAAWFGGLGSGLLAVALGVLAFDYFFLPPLYSLAVQSQNDVLRLIAFTITALFVVALSAKQKSMAQSLWRAHADLQAAVRELERTNVSLRDENAERQRAEVALRESEYSLRRIIETVPALLWSSAPDGELTDVNQRVLEDHFGVRFEDLLLRGWADFVHPDDLSETANAFTHAIQTGTSYQAVHRLRGADGEYRWHQSRSEPLRDREGRIVQWYGLTVNIDEGKKAEDRLRRSEAYLAEAQRLTHCGVTAYKGPTVFYGSEEIYRIWGFDPAQGVPSRKAVLQRIHPDDRDRLNAEVERALDEKRRYSAAYRIVLPDRTEKHIESIGQPVFSKNGELVEVVVTQVDVTDRKRAEQALRRNEAELIEAKRELQQTIDTIPINVNRYGLDGKREFVNAAWKRFTGLSDEAARTMGLYVLVHPDDVADVERKSLEALAEEEPLHIEARLRRADGEYRWHALDRVALRDENGKVTKWYGTSYDIEERKRAEDALRRSETHLAEAQRLSHTGVVTYNGTALVYASEETFRIWGFDPAHGLPTREAAFERIHPGDRDRLNAEVRRAVGEKRRYSVAYRIVLPNGTVKHLETIGQPAFSASGKLVEIVATQTDVTDRKRAEDALRRSEAYLAEAQQLSVTGSFGWSISDNLIVWSQETYHILEIDPAVKPTLDLVFERTHPDDIAFVRRTIEQLATEERDFDFEHRLLLPGRTVKHLHVRTHRVQFDGGKAEVVGAVMDVTASRDAEEALRSAQAELAHASRVATLGELSASIAHEVQQPLTAIAASGNAAIRWLDREGPETAQAIGSITRIINEAHRASQVIHRIRELAKKAEPVMSQVNVNGLIEDVLVLISREATRQRVEVRPQLASELPPALGDRVQLQQVLINLVMNGIQAMAPAATDRTRGLVIRTERHDSDQILVAVEDTGIGIEGENLDRLFGAFYTTKPDGMGMGLSISRSIVEAHGGSIWATRNSGPGMTFHFTLSLYQPAAAASLVS
jgi:PAS domain S-box-containing protein